MHTTSIVDRQARPITVAAFVGVSAALLGIGACDSATPNDDNTRPAGELNILKLAQTAPPLATDSVGFWAYFDEDTEGEIDFAGTGETYLEFRVRKFSLLTRPNGTLFGPGDSVFISIKVIDPTQLLFDFQPSGLVFNAGEPAELKLEYNHAGSSQEGDFDDDGDVDNDDDEIESNLDLWRQENPGEPFERVVTSLLKIELDEIEADIFGFTRYALAY